RCNMGLALARLGRVAEGADVELQAAQAFAAQGYRRMEGACRIYLAAIRQIEGDLPAAVDEAERACAVLEDTPTARTCALARLADALLDACRPDDAVKAASEAVALLESIK